ncbi:MAG TPA: hypothetical protein VGM27_18055 [Acidobacteriaceae bacterium]
MSTFRSALPSTSFSAADKKKINRLSASDQETIERLQPYCGGNVPELLWSLHDLDITRKHRQLVNAYSSPHGLGVYGYGTLPPEFDELMRKQLPDDGYVLPRGPANSDYHIQVRIEVSLGHVGPLAAKPIVAALIALSAVTQAVIKLFDG